MNISTAALIHFLITLTFFLKPLGINTGIVVTDNQVTMSFPTGITFYLSANYSAPIEKVYLHSGGSGRTCHPNGARQAMDIDIGNSVDIEWEWEFKRNGLLTPGAQIWWQWEIIAEDGSTLLTERQTAEIVDQRFDWQIVSNQDVYVQWYSGSPSFGASLLRIATNSLDRLETEMGVRPVGEIWISVYPSFVEVHEAFYQIPDWAGGLAFPSYGSVIAGIPPDEFDWAEEVIPHELTHLLVGELVFNCRGISLPTWLNEGLAIHGEGGVPDDEVIAVEEQLRLDSLLPLTSLERGFSAYGGDAGISYAQSGLVVAYLIETYGPEKLAELLSMVKNGMRAQEALPQVYGLDTQGLDAAWRASLGYGEGPGAGAGPTPAPTRTPVPTLALWTPVLVPTPTPSPTSVPTTSPTSTKTPTSAPTVTLLTSTFIPEPDSQSSVPDFIVSTYLIAGFGGILVVLGALVLVRRANKK